MPHRTTLLVGLLLAGSLFTLAGPIARAAASPGDPQGRTAAAEHALASNAGGGKYAVLINGMGPGAVPSLNTMGLLFKTLINDYGFAKKDIYVLSYDGSYYDFDGDGQSDIDYAATRANIFAVFDTLDFNRDVGGNDVVFVYCDDHGSRTDCLQNGADTGTGELCLYNWVVFRATEMDSLFTNLEDGDLVDNWPKIIAVFDECFGGAFVGKMTAYPRRAVCSASSAKQASNYHWGARPSVQWPSNNYVAFTYHWICAMKGQDPEGNAKNADTNGDGHVSFDEAYQYAKTNDEYAVNKTETPQYWDMEDGYGKRILLDGTELPILIARFWRGRAPFNPGCWGDGGVGDPFGSGIAFVPPGGAQASAAPAGVTTGTRQLYARVHNTGTQPVTSLLARFYYGLPSTIASSADTSLHYVGSASLGMLMPGDSARIGPVMMTDPGLNPFGQSYWKVLAVVESPAIPPESGWVDDDFHVAVENYYSGSSTAGEPVQLNYRVSNPQTQPKKIVLQLARNTLPTGWTIESTPPLGDTLIVPPGASISALVRVHPDGVHGPAGIVTIEERLHDPFTGCWVHCMGPAPEDSSFVSEGGFIRTTGGISFKVTAPFTGAVPETPFGLQVSLAYPNPSSGGVALSYSLPFRSPVRVMIFDITGRCLQKRDLGDLGPGARSFTWDGRDARGHPVPTGTYLLRFQIRGHVEDRRVVMLH